MPTEQRIRRASQDEQQQHTVKPKSWLMNGGWCGMSVLPAPESKHDRKLFSDADVAPQDTQRGPPLVGIVVYQGIQDDLPDHSVITPV